MTELFQDTYFWTALSFVIFAGVAYTMGRKSAMNGLDAYIAHIRARIEEAETLHRKAATQAEEYAKRYANAASEAQAIVDQATSEAQTMLASGQSELQKRLDQRQKQFDAELAQMEASAMNELRARMAEMVEQMALEELQKSLTKDKQSALIDQSIKNIKNAA